MDSLRFDTLAKQLYVVSSRRTGLRLFLASLAAGALGLPVPAAAADCQGKGQPCDKNEDCCSRICRFPGFRKRDEGQAGQEGRAGRQGVVAERRGRKGKKGQRCKRGAKGKKGRLGAERRKNCKDDKKKGTCDCSRLEDRCNVAADCCFADQACETNGCDEHTVCCNKQGGDCTDDCQCCGERSFCDEEGGRCEDCGEKKLTQEGPCEKDEDCCFEDDVCASIFPTCEGRQGDKQCCAKGDGACEETCDCCAPLFCDPDLGRCVAPGSFCPPGEDACLIANPKKPCCPADFPHCCHEDKPFGCCAAGFPNCCDHTREVVVDGQTVTIGCCPETHKCCEETDKALCCPLDQVCCPLGSDIGCGATLEECLDA